MVTSSTHAANEPVLRDVQVEIGHDAEDADAQVGNGQVHEEEIDVVAHLAVAEDDEYHQQVTCTQRPLTHTHTHGKQTVSCFSLTEHVDSSIRRKNMLH